MLNMYKRVIILMILAIMSTFTGCNNSIQRTDAASRTSISNEELEKVFVEYTPKIDGIYAEGYSSKLHDAYKKSNPEQFIEVLSTNELNIMEGIIKLFVGSMFLDGQEGIMNLEKNYENIKKQPGLSRKKKYATYEILAQLVYYKESLHYKE